jgi:DNA replication protein DnaC
VLREVPADEQAACPFGKCDGSTWILDEETNDSRPCRCRDQRVRRAASGGIGTGIGRRFLEVSFEREPIVSLDRRTVLQPVRGFTRSIEANLDTGRGIWFDGPVGTGKTSLAILVAKAASQAGRSYAVFPVPRLLAEIRRTFNTDAVDTYPRLFQKLCTVDLLVLDDLGAEKQTEWVLEQLYSIVNERWQDRRSIVVTTNEPEPDPEVPLRKLDQAAQRIHEILDSDRLDRSGRADLERLVERMERVISRADELDSASDADPIARLRRQIGTRSVSRLREICDDPIPVKGKDLRVTAPYA